MTVTRSAIRRAGPADLDRIARLERECFGETDGVFTRRQLARLLRSPNAHWIISADGRAVSCWLLANNGRARWARLYSLAVHPALRGQGWGERLVRAGMAWMRAKDLTACRAEVKVDNHAARRLYARLGFQEAGHLSDYYGSGVDGVRLIMSLPPPRPTPRRSAAISAKKHRIARRPASPARRGS